MKKFVSLGAALMMGTVLSKNNRHNHEQSSITKADTVKKEPYYINIAKVEDSPESSLDEYKIIEDTARPMKVEYNYEASPVTSKQSIKSSEKPNSVD